jgi:Zn-finger nucleic acid-binding protein
MTAENQDLRSPRDMSPLEIVVWEEWQYGSCPQCHVIFIELCELERLSESHGAPPPDDSSRAEDGREGVEDAVRCSCDGRPLMHRIDQAGVAVDICVRCGSHWFDANEIEEYMASRQADWEDAEPPTRFEIEQVPRRMIKGFFKLWIRAL